MRHRYAYLSGGHYAGRTYKLKSDKKIIRMAVVHADGFYLRYERTSQTMTVHDNGEKTVCRIFDYKALEQKLYSSGKPNYIELHTQL